MLLQRGTNGEVVVVGAGYAGVELAATLAEKLKGAARVRVVTAGGLHGQGCLFHVVRVM
jgi:NADH:ubiquinone reductase (non-electrogenic)